MFLSEILSRKKYLDSKMLDINNYISNISDLSIQGKSDIYNKAIEEKFALLTKIQSHVVLLQEQNLINSINIGNNELTVNDAVKLRHTLQSKIDTLDFLISRGDFKVINVFNLMIQRDALFDEFTVLNIAILKSDSNTSWDNE